MELDFFVDLKSSQKKVALGHWEEFQLHLKQRVKFEDNYADWLIIIVIN